MAEIPLIPADEEGIVAAVQALSEGHLILHPTETVASLSGDPYDAVAVEAAQRLKGYEQPRPFLCIVGTREETRELIRTWDPVAYRLAEAFWPGPLTLIFRAAENAPEAVLSMGRVALRLAVDPVTSAVLAEWQRPIFSTSANRAGDPPPLQVEAAATRLASAPGSDRIDLGLIGESRCPEGPPSPVPSTIVDLTGDAPRLVREGPISSERLLDVVSELEI